MCYSESVRVYFLSNVCYDFEFLHVSMMTNGVFNFFYLFPYLIKGLYWSSQFPLVLCCYYATAGRYGFVHSPEWPFIPDCNETTRRGECTEKRQGHAHSCWQLCGNQSLCFAAYRWEKVGLEIVTHTGAPCSILSVGLFCSSHFLGQARQV